MIFPGNYLGRPVLPAQTNATAQGSASRGASQSPLEQQHHQIATIMQQFFGAAQPTPASAPSVMVPNAAAAVAAQQALMGAWMAQMQSLLRSQPPNNGNSINNNNVLHGLSLVQPPRVAPQPAWSQTTALPSVNPGSKQSTMTASSERPPHPHHAAHDASYRAGSGSVGLSAGYRTSGARPSDQHSHADHKYRMQDTRYRTVTSSAPEPASCGPCQKRFPNLKMYEAHVKQHVTCSECSFSAAKRIVKEHEAVTHGLEADQHAPSYQPVVVRMESPEEISRWIEDRKRRYPTQTNVNRKAEEEVSSRFSLPPHKAEEDKQRREYEALNRFRPENHRVRIDPSGNVVPDRRPSRIASVRDAASRNPYARPPCKYVNRPGGCRNGDRCRFLHDRASVAADAAATEPRKHGKRETVSSMLSLSRIPDHFRPDNLSRMMLKSRDQDREMAVVDTVIRFLHSVDYLGQLESKIQTWAADDHNDDKVQHGSPGRVQLVAGKDEDTIEEGEIEEGRMEDCEVDRNGYPSVRSESDPVDELVNAIPNMHNGDGTENVPKAQMECVPDAEGDAFMRLVALLEEKVGEQ